MTKGYIHYKNNKTLNTSELLVVIPAYNEEKSLSSTIKSLTNSCEYDYLIVDDGSTDKTVQLCMSNNYNYVSHKTNKGLSESMRTGMSYALNNGYKYVVQFDADGQHDANSIINFHSSLTDGYDVVCGNRYEHEESIKSKSKKFIHSIIAFLFKMVTHHQIYDPTNGMRGFNWIFMNFYIMNTNLTVEPSGIALATGKLRLKIENVSACIRQREVGQSVLFSSHWKKIKYIIKQSWALSFGYWFIRLRLKMPEIETQNTNSADPILNSENFITKKIN